jgi:hypothetical protein
MLYEDLFKALQWKYHSKPGSGGDHITVETVSGGRYRAFFASGKFVHVSTGADNYPTADAAIAELVERAHLTLPQLMLDARNAFMNLAKLLGTTTGVLTVHERDTLSALITFIQKATECIDELPFAQKVLTKLGFSWEIKTEPKKP